VIAAQGISKFIGKRELFCDVSFHISPGDRIGLIGPNGAGKSTLMHVLLGEMEPDAGMVSRTKHLRMCYLPQQWTPIQGRTVLTYATDIDQSIQSVRRELQVVEGRLKTHGEEYPLMEEDVLRQAHLLEQMEALGGYDLEARAAKILTGLGFGTERLQESVSSLSGGWVMRLELARLLISEPDLMLLDEPTNHLDLDALTWLEDYLLGTRSAVLIVSHDRAFLNRIVQRVFEIEMGRFQEYSGNYDFYLVEKARRQEILLASYKNQQERLRQIERFIDRNRYRKDRARQVQSRIKALEKVDRIEVPLEEDTIRFRFPEPQRCGKRVIELEDIQKSYGEHVVYSGVNLVVERGDRIAFLGHNGAGKSTLLKILAGETEIQGGQRRLGHQVGLGYYAQYQWEQLKPEWTVLQEAMSVSGDLPQSRLRGLLGAFLFDEEDVQKRVSVLSGGEKARLTLCKLLLQQPNALFLDEPTNHLDIESRNVLEEALSNFEGTVCFISHDRHFINSIANKILVIQRGHVDLFPGNYDDFLSIWKHRTDIAAETGNPTPDSTPSEKGGAAPSGSRKAQEQKRLEAQKRNELYRIKTPLQKKLDSLESTLEGEQSKLDAMKAQLADPSTYQDGTDIRQLNKAYHECHSRVMQITEEWEQTAMELEELESSFWMDNADTRANIT
jgi:ATP-binding cassette, subfamily F, member 3